MRILIDARTIRENKAGIGIYTYNLLTELAKLDKTNEYKILFFNFLNQVGNLSLNNNFQVTNYKYFHRKLFNLLGEYLPNPFLDIYFKNQDIVHFTDLATYPLKNTKIVITVHDLAFKQYPDFVKLRNLKLGNNKLPRALDRCHTAIAVSYFTKKEIIKYYGVSAEKIRVIYNGVDARFKKINDKALIENFKKKYNLNKKIILFVGTIEPRKNLPRLVEAFHKLRYRADFNLVIAGGKGWKYEQVFDLVDKLKLSDEVVFTGYLADDELPLLYNCAKLFVFPSFCEGFGIPVIEAMACGVPVITSDTSSLPEIIGNAGLLIDPLDADSITGAMERVLTDSEVRHQMIAQGLKRAKSFSWENTARQTLQVYQAVMG